MFASGPGSLTIVDLENAVGTALAMAELGVAAPLQIQGRYRLSRLLGRGARGVVCQARDLHLHRDVAIKLVPALGIELATQEVSHEAQALARACSTTFVPGSLCQIGRAHSASILCVILRSGRKP